MRITPPAARDAAVQAAGATALVACGRRRQRQQDRGGVVDLLRWRTIPYAPDERVDAVRVRGAPCPVVTGG
jgi:hypothetical protein